MAEPLEQEEAPFRINNEPASDLDFSKVLAAQRAFFRSGVTRPIGYRRRQLETLHNALSDREASIQVALREDLGKPAYEAYGTETGLLLAELRYTLKHLGAWMRPESVPTPLVLFPSRSYVLREPLGTVLIIAPWNYPLDLVVGPLIGALAAGNCAMLKPSELAPHTSALIAELVAACFPPKLVSTTTGGGAEVGGALVRERFDHIFFTGSPRVGREVAMAAAAQLTPVTLELGGKSPCILDETCRLDIATRRITWGKFLNAGQTCIAPDYLLVPRGKKSAVVDRVKKHLRRFFGNDVATSPDFARIVSARHFDRLSGYIDEGRVLVGGERERETRFIAPTLIDEVSEDAKVLSEEIFGPILPIVEYDGLDDALTFIQRAPEPLALYVFSDRPETQERILREVPFGGGCVNNTVVQFANPHLPFGGRGPSGMGRYHGRDSFELFSHRKSVVRSTTLFDLWLYPPYAGKLRWLKKVLR